MLKYSVLCGISAPSRIARESGKEKENEDTMIGFADGEQSRASGLRELNGASSRNHHANGHVNGVRIRNYWESDRQAIHRLCCDTGFLGSPIDAVFQDRDLFAALFARPYLDQEPEWALVAEAQGQVIGYLLGSVGKDFELARLRGDVQTACQMVFRLATGRYARHPRSRQFIRWVLAAGFWEQPKHPRDAAHFHFNIDKRYRGRGLGRRLWKVYEERLHSAGVQECYGAFFSWPQRRPESAYARYGFTVFDRRHTTLFAPEVAEPVECVCMHKRL
jgi:ribosomal protein S18 acetylase RimI-like enzyme